MLPDFEFTARNFAKYGLEISQRQFEQLDIYAEFLVEYNKNVNLTALTEPNDILFKHFIDSILLAKYVDLSGGKSLIDVGTGAGFPSVPLKIFAPSLKITLLDSLNKRINFLTELCDRLGIEADCVHGRAEDIAKMPEYREKFDIACARAVANMALLSEYCIPFVRVGGIFAAMKGPTEDIQSAQNAIKILGGEVADDFRYEVESEGRRIITVKKISHTSTKYPRNSSQIKKKML